MNSDAPAIVRAAFEQIDEVMMFWIVTIALTVACVIIFAPKGRKSKRKNSHEVKRH